MNAATLESASSSKDDKRQENILPLQNRKISHAFIWKVLSIVISQIILTCIIVAPMILHQPTRELLQHPRIIWAPVILFLAFHMAIIFCCNGIPKSYPQNYIVLLASTITTSLCVGCVCANNDLMLVLIVFGICLVFCTAAYLFATQTAIDFSPALGIILIFAIAIGVLFVLSVFFPANGLRWILWIAVIVITFIYLFIRIQQTMTGRHTYSSAPEADYLDAAIYLYFYINFLFVYTIMISRNI